MMNKYNKLTFISVVGRTKNGQSIWLCQCDCGKEWIGASHHVKDGSTKSCGCSKKEVRKYWMRNNTHKRKLLLDEEIPVEYRHLIKLNLQTCLIGKRHKEMFSLVKCIHCNREKLVRNSRIRENIKKFGYLYHCHGRLKEE